MTHLVTALSSLSLPASNLPNLYIFRDLFLQWNRRINLSAARSPDEVEAHIRDSLHVISHLRLCPRVIDVGSGGGFPVVIAAICLPTSLFTALEPIHKKHAFLRTVARELDLVNLDALATRIEDHSPRGYDAATSRATFDLREWLLLGSQLVRPGGIVVGFEATPRYDLPQPFERFPYSIDDKPRSLIVQHRPSDAPT